MNLLEAEISFCGGLCLLVGHMLTDLKVGERVTV
jgi:hypothetical protein